MIPYRRLAAFVLASLRGMSGALPLNSPRLRSRDVWVMFQHVAVVVLLFSYVALMRERNLWLHGNSALTTAYLHDLLDSTSCQQWWSWGVDLRLMPFGSEVREYYNQGRVPEVSAPAGDW